MKSLTATLSWSELVARNAPVRQSSLYFLLIASDARHNLLWAKEKLERIAELQENVRLGLERLSKFGVFSWHEWFADGSKDGGLELASHLLERIQNACSNIDSVLSWSKYHVQRLNCKTSGLGEISRRSKINEFQQAWLAMQ